MLEVLGDAGRVDMEGDELMVVPEGLRYRAVEAVRVLREVTTGDDPPKLCGTVQARAYLTDELGGELLGDSMLVDDSAYDVVPGLACQPLGEKDLEGLPAGSSEESILESLQRAAS
jgi:hypothetical protein